MKLITDRVASVARNPLACVTPMSLEADLRDRCQSLIARILHLRDSL